MALAAGCALPEPDPGTGAFLTFPDANTFATRVCEGPIKDAGGPNINVPTGAAGSAVTASRADGFRRITVQPLELTLEGYQPVGLYCHVDSLYPRPIVTRSSAFPADAFAAGEGGPALSPNA